jgi:hypothetical protein
MDALPPLVMSFPTLDEAESALDWIGVDFTETEGAFQGELVPDDRELLDEAIADAETPAPVRELAEALVRLLEAAGVDGSARWRVVFVA